MITVVGEALVDFVADTGSPRFTAHTGGSPANVAVGLARLGSPVTLATQLGDDVLGRMAAGHIRESGVTIDMLPAHSSATSLALAVLDPDGAASYDFRVNWDVTHGPELRPDCRCLHTGSLALALDDGATVIEGLVRRVRGEVLVSYDPNIRPSLSGPPETERLRVERQVRECDVVKASLDDVQWLYPDLRYENVAAAWLELGPSLVVITLGGRGAYAVNHASAIVRPAPEIRVEDTVGAGDSFTAGLLTAMSDRELLHVETRDALAAAGDTTLAELLDYACAVAAVTCGRAGADPPTRAELDWP